jgi:hypothetical protein
MKTVLRTESGKKARKGRDIHREQKKKKTL